MVGSGPHGYLELLKSFCSNIQNGHLVSLLETVQTSLQAILKGFNYYLLPDSKWKALGQHGDLELLKWFSSDIQDGHHGSHLENLPITSARER